MEIEQIRKNIKNKKQLKKSKSHFSWFFLKLCLTIILTLVCLIVLKAKPKYEKKFYQIVYEEQLPFTKFKKLYQKYLGKFLPDQLLQSSTKKVFEEKLTFEKKEPYEEGYKLTVQNSYLTPALNSGMVVFVGKKDNYNQTVIIQQIDGTDVWYGNLANVSVKLYDYVEKGSLVGETNQQYLYLVFKKDGQIVDGKEYF